MMSIDIKNCFDTIKHKTLQDKLVNAGLSRNGMHEQWMMHSLADRTHATQVEAHITEYKKHEWGIPQGSVLSPIVSAIYLADLDVTDCEPTKLWGKNAYAQIGLNQAQYADDLIVWCESSSLVEVKRNLNRALKITRGWCAKNGMQFSLKKCESLFLRDENTKEELDRPYATLIELNRFGEPENKLKIKNKNSVPRPDDATPTLRYLGVHFDQSFSYKRNAEIAAAKAKSKLRFIDMYDRNSNDSAKETNTNHLTPQTKPPPNEFTTLILKPRGPRRGTLG
jgi:hypothetical protein